jgi:hypothetical protein
MRRGTHSHRHPRKKSRRRKAAEWVGDIADAVLTALFFWW